MITIRKGIDRGRTKIDWLDSWHSFSFGEYYDPAHMGYRSLRVINEDIVAPGMGFGTHPHRNMEIITIILSGELGHQDSTGENSIIRPGVIQKMTAGKGILHSEINPSNDTPVHLLQIWIMPEVTGLAPSYQESKYDLNQEVTLLAAPNGQGGLVSINQQAKLFNYNLKNDTQKQIELESNKYYWLQLAQGGLTINNEKLLQGDAVKIENENILNISNSRDSQFLLFELN